MKYQRLALRYSERMTGSTFSQPQWRVNIDAPENHPVKIALEGCFLNTDKDSGSNQSYVRISLKNATSMNSITTIDGGFMLDDVLGRISLMDHSGHASYNIYNKNPEFNDINGNLLVYSNNVFKNGILELKITYGDEDTDTIVSQSDNIQDNYTIILGIWTEE